MCSGTYIGEGVAALMLVSAMTRVQPRRRIPAALLISFVFLIELIVFWTISRFRLVDGDEGFYVMTSRLITEGKVPYHDFLLTQMPLLPYVYGWWMYLAGMTWISARLLSAIFAAALGTALFSEVTKQTGKRTAGLAAAAILLFSTNAFAWLTLVKTYALSMLLVFLAYRACLRGLKTAPGIWLSAAGLLLGASVDVRLYFAVLLPVFLWWIYRNTTIASRAAALLWMLSGFAVTMVPNIYLLARDPRVFFWDNLGFHAVRSDHGLIGNFANKAITLGRLFLTRNDGNGLQMTLLACFILLVLIRSRRVDGEARLALALGLSLSLVSLLPTPTFVQYFCVTIPFFIVFIVCSMSRLLDSLTDGADRRRMLVLCTAALLIFVMAAAPDYSRFLMTGNHVIGVWGQERARNWRISDITAVSEAIDKKIHPAEAVLSLWPGYIFQSKAQPYAGLENNSATHFADQLSPAELNRYHILSPRQIEADIAARVPRLVVVGNQETMDLQAEPFEKALTGSGYKVEQKFGSSTLWSLQSPPARIIRTSDSGR